MKVRTVHRRLGILIVCFLLIQVIAGMLMAAGRLSSADNSQLYKIMYTLHADWDPLGSIYRVALGLAAVTQGILGIAIFLGSLRSGRPKKESRPSRLPSGQTTKKEEPSMAALGFAKDIRPLFREKDVSAMKPGGIDLSSYDDVKKRARDIYGRLSAGEMPCDGAWSEDWLKTLKEWIDGGMAP